MITGRTATHVVTIHRIKNGREEPSHWPAWAQSDGSMLTDLRLFVKDTNEKSYQPEVLRADGIPEHYIEAAGTSQPAGFLLLKYQ